MVNIEVKKISLYTYQVAFAAIFLWVCLLATSMGTPYAYFLPLFFTAGGCMIVIVVGLTKIRKAVGLDVTKKKVD